MKYTVTKDKCSNCGKIRSKKFWTFKDKTRLCDDCHWRYGELWQKDIDTKETHPTYKEKIGQELKGLGGWLIIPVSIMFVLIISAIFSFIISLVASISKTGWSLFFVFIYLGLLALYITTLVFIFQKSLLGKKLMIASFYANLINTAIADMLLYSDPEEYIATGITFFITWILIKYLNNSERVKNTFTK
jgi:hypothetical protein